MLTDEDKTRQNVINRQLRLVREQLTRTRARLNDDQGGYCEHCKRGGMPDHHRAQLLRALSQLLEDERVLRRIAPPKPEPVQRYKAGYTPPMPTPAPIAQPSSPAMPKQ